MKTIAWRVYMEAPMGASTQLPRSGNGLENPFVYDASARDLKRLEAQGLLHILHEQRGRCGTDEVITDVTFAKLR